MDQVLLPLPQEGLPCWRSQIRHQEGQSPRPSSVKACDPTPGENHALAKQFGQWLVKFMYIVVDDITLPRADELGPWI